MKLGFFFSCLIMSFIAACQPVKFINSDKIITYEKHLSNQQYYSEVRSLLGEEKYEEAVNILEKIECNGMLCKAKNIYLAIAYSNLNEYRKAKKSLKNAVSQGYELKYLTKDIYKPIVEKNNFAKIWESYEGAIDTNLRTKLIEMAKLDQKHRKSFNRARMAKDTSTIDSLGVLINRIDSANLLHLHQIVKENGWPGIAVVGHSVMFSDPDAALLVMHAPEKDNIVFFEHIYNACLKGEEEWSAAESVMQNLLMRFESKNYPFHKMRHVYVENGKLNINKSSFQLKILSNVLIRHPHISIKLYATNNNSIELLKEVNNFLIEHGAPSNQISISNTPAPFEDDNLGDYQIVFTRTYHRNNGSNNNRSE